LINLEEQPLDLNLPQPAAPAERCSLADLAISASGITKLFQSGDEADWVLKGINLAVPPGDIQLLMGPSGSGKTTLLSILSGILTPTAGTVSLLGQNITQLSSSQAAAFRLHNIGFIFQDANLFPALTAVENVELALQLKGMPARTIHAQALALLAQFGLADKTNHLPHHLSGGQKQLVAAARAFAGNPQIIMADEPTASLDAQNGRAVIDLLHQFAKAGHHTVVMVTHDYRIIDIADRISMLENGELHNQEMN
jgi:putative ABC transport system ATP-binding protein